MTDDNRSSGVNDITQLMQQTAEDAVRFAFKEAELTLDYSLESTPLVNELMNQLIKRYDQQVMEQKALFTLSNMLGAYLGECVRRVTDAEWLYDTSNEQAPIIFLKHGENTYAFAGYCFEKLMNDNSIDVGKYTQQVALNIRSKQH